MRYPRWIGCLSIAIALGACSWAQGVPYTLEKIAFEGDASPDGNGTINRLFQPTINNNGDIAFEARIEFNASLEDAVILSSGNSLLVLARTDGSSALVSAISEPKVNNLMQVAFLGQTINGQAVFRADTGGVQVLAEVGDTASNSINAINGINSSTGLWQFNDAGQVAFTDVTGFDRVFLTDGTTLLAIAEGNMPVPSTGGTLTGSSFLTNINGAGQVLFAGANSGDSAYFLSEGVAPIPVIVEGDASPVGDGSINATAGAVLNDLGQVGYAVSITGTSGSTRRLFFDDGVSTSLLLENGDLVPGGNGAFQFFSPAALNDSGQMLVRDTLAGTSGGADDDNGLFLIDGMVVETIVRQGDLTPDGGSVFAEPLFSSTSLNEAGQVLFTAKIGASVGAIDTVNALFLWDPDDGLSEVLRIGDMLEGQTVSGLVFVRQRGISGLNDQGEIALIAFFESGDSGVFLATAGSPISVGSIVPEPATFPGCLVMLGLISRRRRTKSCTKPPISPFGSRQQGR